MQPPETNRACRSCGSALCSRDDACPTCETCGRRGHTRCVAATEPVATVAPPQAGGACKLSAFVDVKNERVVLEIGVAGTKGAFQFFFDRPTLASFCTKLIDLGVELGKRQPGEVSLLPQPDGRPITPTEIRAAMALRRAK